MQGEFRRLSDAEVEIMQAIWRADAPLTSTEIQAKLRGRRNWSLPAVMTALARLAEKGYVNCDRSTRTNLYSALVEESAYKQREGRSFLEKLYDNSVQNFVAALYDAKDLTPRDIEELRALIDSFERGKADD